MKTATKANERYVGVFPFSFDDSSVSIPDTIHLIPIGQWEHDLYGSIVISASDIRQFELNFNAAIRKGVPITAGHEGYAELPAVGWITKVEARENGLWGSVDWTEQGKALLSDKAFKFFSPEFYREYEDPQTHETYPNVLTGGALTKSPYFKELEAVVFSEKALQKQFNETMPTLAELLAKDITTLSDEEKTFIKEHKAELTAEQLTSHTAIVDEPAAAADAEEPKAEETPAAEEPAAPAAEEPKVEASEKVSMSALEYNLLKKKANEGALAFAELEKTRLDSAVSKLVFSESNKTGNFLPKTQDKLRAFMEKLDAGQRLAFSSLVAELPKQQLFTEVGEGAAADANAANEVEAKVEAKIKASEGKLTYAAALKEVMASEKGLEERYDASLPSGKKVQA